jgi:hypothetical protein
VTKGKEDDKVYRGLNYYNQYIDKKESLIGTLSYRRYLKYATDTNSLKNYVSVFPIPFFVVALELILRIAVGFLTVFVSTMFV